VEKREEMATMRNGGTADLVNARNIHLDVVDGEHGWGILPGDVCHVAALASKPHERKISDAKFV
jgi:hypothetical protein